MKAYLRNIFLCSVFTILQLFGQQISQQPAVFVSGKFASPYILGDGGTMYYHLSLTTNAFHKHHDRTPLNLSIVIDRSGSMEDQKKMEYAKRAFQTLIDQLEPNDLLSIIIYDDKIDVIRPALPVGRKKNRIKEMISDVYPRGSTNLAGGLLQGLDEVKQRASDGYTNRVILLSDGLANVGMTDPLQINKKVRTYRDRSISVTTMGVGLDYNENLMMAIAESGGGNYYFIEHPSMLSGIVRTELDAAASVVAQRVSVQIQFDPRCTVKDVIGYSHQIDAGVLTIPIGDLYENDSREITIEFTVPHGKEKFRALSCELKFPSNFTGSQEYAFQTEITYTDSPDKIDENRNHEVQSKVDVALSTRSVEKALAAIDKGDRAGAESAMDEAQMILEASPSMGRGGRAEAALRTQLGKVQQYDTTMQKEEDQRKLKKSIQFDNYKTQRKK